MTLIQLLNTVQLSANKVHNCMKTERVSRPVILGLKTDLQYISIKETNYFLLLRVKPPICNFGHSNDKGTISLSPEKLFKY